MPGDDVKIMQANLNKISKLALQPSTFPPLLKDGVFGPRTCRRVKEFQRLNRLRIDGIIGPKTKDMLARLAVRGRQRRPGGASESTGYLDRAFGNHAAPHAAETREKQACREAEEETFPGPEEALVEAIRDEKGLALARAVYARRRRRKHA
jgi:peptidoglycan hydrolase-like protein with peptidoglycan-binding domain